VSDVRTLRFRWYAGECPSPCTIRGVEYDLPRLVEEMNLRKGGELLLIHKAGKPLTGYLNGTRLARVPDYLRGVDL
jgi:hypothetical protein